MRLERSKNAVRNAIFGTVSNIVNVVMPFLCRTIFIKTLGADYLGLNSMFGAVLSVLSLSELGFGTAITFCMYKPIAEDDKETIDALLAFFKKAYRVIGLIILSVGLSLIPFLKYMIHGTYPADINIIVVYVVFLVNTVMSYFMFAYRGAIIGAFQRGDLLSRINMFMTFASNTIQIVLLLTFKNYYAYIAVTLVFTLLNNLRTAYVAKKYFPQYQPKGTINKETKAVIKEKVSGLLINKVCQMSRNSFDSIFVSAFLGLALTGIYNNYYYVMNSIINILGIVSGSVLAGAGNSVAMETQDKNYQDMKKMNFLYMWIAGWCTICLVCLYQPFMKLWVGDTMMFPMPTVMLFCLYFYVLKMGDVRAIYDYANGLWWQNRYRAIAEALANIGLNYLLGKFFGVNGIVAATLISLFFINFCYGSQIIFKYYFKGHKVSEYFAMHGLYALVTLTVGIVTFIACRYIPEGYIGFIGKMAVCAILPNVMYFVIYRKTKKFALAMQWALPKFKLEKKLGFLINNKLNEE